MAVPGRDALLSEVKRRLSPGRALHTLGVEAAAACLAARWGADAGAARSAALLHDMTKEEADQLQIMRMYGILPSVWEETAPGVYHALTAAALAAGLGFDRETVSAVRWHTTGRAGMTVLDKIIYLADKTEPFRPPYPGLAEIKALMYTDLDRAVAAALRRITRWNIERGKPVDKNSAEALEWIEGK